MVLKTDTNEVEKVTLPAKRTIKPAPTPATMPIITNHQNGNSEFTVNKKDSLQEKTSVSYQEASKRIDDVIEIANRVALSNPGNFDIVFKAALDVYVMSTFRSNNNMSITIDI